MSIVSKLMKTGIATKVINEAKKPENQAKVKAAVKKVQDKRRPAAR